MNLQVDRYQTLLRSETDKFKLQTINIGVRHDATAKQIGETVKALMRYSEQLRFDTNRPDGKLPRLIDFPRITRLESSNTVSSIAVSHC